MELEAGPQAPETFGPKPMARLTTDAGRGRIPNGSEGKLGFGANSCQGMLGLTFCQLEFWVWLKVQEIKVDSLLVDAWLLGGSGSWTGNVQAVGFVCVGSG